MIPTVGITGKVRSTDDLREAPWDFRAIGQVEGPRHFLGFDGRDFPWTPGD